MGFLKNKCSSIVLSFFFLSTWHAASMNFLLVTEVKQRLIAVHKYEVSATIQEQFKKQVSESFYRKYKVTGLWQVTEQF
jgi:hypothetical protein